MRSFLKILLTLLVLLILAAVAVPFFVPADKIKGEVLAEIEARTGRKVGIGHLHFSLLPSLSLDAEDVRIANPAWAGGGDMARIKTLKLGLELWPLLHKQYRLKELVLEEPVIALHKNSGQTNWDFNRPGAKLVVSPGNAGARAAHHGSALNQLYLDAITVKDGSFSYKEGASDKALSRVNLTLKAPFLSEKLELKGNAVYEGAKAELDITVEKPLAFQDHAPSGLQLKAQVGALAFTYDGTAVLAANGIVGLNGKLNVPTLDTRDLMQTGGKSAAAVSPAAAPAPANAARWSDAPIRLDALGRLEADLELTVGTLALPKTTLKNVTASVKLHKGALQVQTGAVAAYGGMIRLSLAANTANAVSLAFAAAKAEAQPFLHDFAGYDRLSGVIDLDMRLSTSGGSMRAMVNALSGQGQVRFSDGKLKGVDLAAMLRRLGGTQADENASTDFSELSASFQVARGIVSTEDIKMNSPLLRVSGAGEINLPNWQENLLLKPMLVASIQGQGGKETPGIVVPVHVVGPLDHPRYQADLAATIQDNLATLKDPDKLKQSVKDLRKSLLQNNGAGLKGLLR